MAFVITMRHNSRALGSLKLSCLLSLTQRQEMLCLQHSKSKISWFYSNNNYKSNRICSIPQLNSPIRTINYWMLRVIILIKLTIIIHLLMAHLLLLLSVSRNLLATIRSKIFCSLMFIPPSTKLLYMLLMLFLLSLSLFLTQAAQVTVIVLAEQKHSQRNPAEMNQLAVIM